MDETECGIEGCTGFTCALCGKCTAECPNMKCSRDAIGAQPMSELECLDSRDPKDPCEGEVELRDALSATGTPYPRCDKHWKKRVAKQHELEQAFPDSPNPPKWFDPTYAGERWDEDD